MQVKTIEIDELTLHINKDKQNWQINIPKSQTKAEDVRQMVLLTEPSDYLAPFEIEDQDDAFQFQIAVDEHLKSWDYIRKLRTNEKLRLLCNVAKLKQFLTTRLTFSLHPETILFDENLMPVVTYRGLRNLVPPYELNDDIFLKQFKCYIIALFSKKFTFDDLYNGSLKNASETDFQKKVRDAESIDELEEYLRQSYLEEQKKTELTMKLVPVRRFRLFKVLSIIMIAISVLLAAPLAYYGLIKGPYQESLLEAHGHFLSSDYNQVISTLRNEDPEKLPFRTKYILANSYINVEKLSDRERDVILKNVSLRSDPDYLLYWIYNGRGEFEQSLEKAKYIDDAQLIMYGLIKQIEVVKNNPNLTGSERDEKLKDLQDQLERYMEDYNLTEEDSENPGNIIIEVDAEADETEENSNDDNNEENDHSTDDNDAENEEKDNEENESEEESNDDSEDDDEE